MGYSDIQGDTMRWISEWSVDWFCAYGKTSLILIDGNSLYWYHSSTYSSRCYLSRIYFNGWHCTSSSTGRSTKFPIYGKIKRLRWPANILYLYPSRHVWKAAPALAFTSPWAKRQIGYLTLINISSYSQSKCRPLDLPPQTNVCWVVRP